MSIDRACADKSPTDPEHIDTAKPNAAAMPAHVEQTVRSIALLHAKHHQDASKAQRSIDRLTAFAGRPFFLGLVCAAVVLWSVENATASWLGLRSLDPPPFAWLELATTVSAVVIAVLILVTQRNADRLADLRGQMTLELASLTEQKVAKIIELLEELRRDSPQVRNRVDPEASEMSIRSDAHAVLGAIKTVDSELRADGSQDTLPTGAP